MESELQKEYDLQLTFQHIQNISLKTDKKLDLNFPNISLLARG